MAGMMGVVWAADAVYKELGVPVVGAYIIFLSLFCRRKRGEKGEVVETVEDVIVRKLTAERVEELKKVIKETQEKYRYMLGGSC